MATDYKSLLQQLLQKRYPSAIANEIISYETTLAPNQKIPRFISTIKIYPPGAEPLIYVGVNNFPSKKQAEQAVAEEAFNAVGKIISEEPQGQSIQLSMVTNSNECNQDYKSRLQQLIQKHFPNITINELIQYQTTLVSVGKFESQVTINIPNDTSLPITSSGEFSSKRAAEQNAAELAYNYFMHNMDQLTNNNVQQQQNNNSNANPTRDYKSSLQLLLQQRYPRTLISDLIQYKTNSVVQNNSFVFNSSVLVSINGDICEYNGAGTYPSKKIAEQYAAEVAFNYFSANGDL